MIPTRAGKVLLNLYVLKYLIAGRLVRADIINANRIPPTLAVWLQKSIFSIDKPQEVPQTMEGVEVVNEGLL